jgi:hypothetical protein
MNRHASTILISVLVSGMVSAGMVAWLNAQPAAPVRESPAKERSAAWWFMPVSNEIKGVAGPFGGKGECERIRGEVIATMKSLAPESLPQRYRELIEQIFTSCWEGAR